MLLEPFKRTKVLRFGSQSKKVNYSVLYLEMKSKARLKFCVFGLNFVSDSAQVGPEARCIIASCNILAVDNNSLEDLPWRFLFCHEISSFRSTCTIRGLRPPEYKFNDLFVSIFSRSFFFIFKTILLRKNWRGGKLVQ